MDQDNRDSELIEEEVVSPIEEEPKQKPKAAYRQKNMEKARLARMKKIKDRKKNKAFEYDIKDEDDEDKDSDEEVDEDVLQAILDAKKGKKKKAEPKEVPEDTDKVINRIDRLEDVMTQLIDLHKKERRKNKKLISKAGQPSNTKIVLIPPNGGHEQNQPPKSNQSQLDAILEMAKRGGIFK